ncbi:MAG: acyltransferase domain-containing protein, partial [Gammaproteobacteria bacterium]|nr:acyltransferase domain-containing protein [Gammaproteobacteria bacterium]
MPSEKIVVSGYSCRLPESDSASEFWDNLVAHKDMVTADDRRWPVDFLDIPPRFGKLKTLDKFDAQFFEVHAKQANKMDPQLRLLMEVSYEAIKSAGVNPSDLSGTNTGVFVGASSNDADSIFGASIDGLSGYENTGCASSMFANRLSYSFNFTGPSETIDTACSSSLVALHAAMQALALGECDRALVAGCNVILRPNTTVGFKKLKMVAEDGTSRSFDEKGSGFARAEGIVAILLCKESLAHRIIATVLGSATNNDGYTEQGITYPSGQAQHNLLCGLYQRQGIDPAQVKYIEAHGTGTHAGDPQEANALTDFFCATRPASELPLLIGSVKSNMGHSEPAAGLAGMVKVLLSMEHKLIPANLHYDSPNPEIPGLADGRLRVVDSNMAWDGGIVGISSFGFGGTNAHVILEDNCDAKHTEDAPLPIIPFAARTKEAFDTLSEYAASDRITKDETQLLQRVAAARGNTHPFRGCVVRLNNGLLKTQANNEVRTKPPVWFVFPGMGAQWPGMGAALLEFSTFSDAILRCAAALKDTEIDLYKIINAEIDAQRLSVTEIFVSLTAIQIALVDLMGSLGIRADGMIGHSVGEIACGYADGGLSAEQAILAAYWRGQCVLDTPEVAGKMAVVPMDWESAGVICPQQVDRACHNSADSVTLSGNARAIDKLVEELLAQDIDARTVNSSGIAFHSVNMAKIAPNLQQKLESIIPDPKMRSDRWISSSRPTHEWNLAATCSAEYYANNLCNPVRFYEALQHIPENAVIIEIGAHTLMRKAIVDTVNGCCHVGLMVKERNNTDDFLEALAKCYTQGIDLNWQEIYPVTAPITSGCDIPGLTGWDHTQSWEVPSYKNYIAGGGPGMEIPFHIDINEEEFAYLGDHKINDKVLFPGVGYLFLVWKKLAQLHNTPLGKLPICFENVSIDRATALYSDAPVELTVRYMSASTTFEIVNRSERVAHGRVRVGADVQADLIPGDHVAPEHSEAMALSKEEIYKEFRLRNYQYGPSFRQLSSLNVDGSGGVIDWDGNWVTFLDAILQSSLLKIDRQTVVPTRFRRFAIDPTRQPDTGQIQLFSHTFLPQIHSAAVRLDGLECAPISVVSKIESPTLSAYEFMPYHCIAPRDDYIADYLRTTEHYIIDAALSAIKTAEENLWSIPEHIERLKQELLKHESLSQTQLQAQPQWRNKLAMYMAEPNAFHLRLAEYIFSDPKPLFENALARIVSYPDYHQIYKSDLRVALLFNDRYLGSLVDIVLENAAAVSPIRVCEVGAGTGGISDHILRKLYNNKFKYIFTDVSAGFFEKLRKNFDQYSAVTDFQPWDIRDALPHSIGGPVDLIVASNCIHAVPNLRTALHNIREALTEQGFFLLHEATSTHYAVLSTWGFIDQLWHYDDPQDRSSGAY